MKARDTMNPVEDACTLSPSLVKTIAWSIVPVSVRQRYVQLLLSWSELEEDLPGVYVCLTPQDLLAS